MSTLIDVSLMPLCGEVTPEQLSKADFGQHYSHENESACPGYYQVLLQESGVNVEVSATEQNTRQNPCEESEAQR